MRGAVLLALAAAVAVIALDRLWLRRRLQTMGRMLDRAIGGTFSAETFDESRLSAVEQKLARWLVAQTNAADRLTAEQARMRALIADISHQTKTPIAGILLYQGLLAEAALPDDCRSYVEALGGQAEKLRFLIDALIKAGRLETGVIVAKPAPASVQPLLQAVAGGARAAAAEKNVSLTVLPGEATACMDEKWTREALSNLVDNAVKYTPAGGAVTLSCTPYELFCRIDVRDTGIGIAESEQGHIFERFYRSPAVRGQDGVGLGLYLAREIAAVQGGYLKVSSAPTGGSLFSLFLPREM